MSHNTNSLDPVFDATTVALARRLSERHAREAVLDVEEQRRLAGGDRTMRRHLAENPSLVEELQHELADDPDPLMHRGLARNPALVLTVQQQLADHPDAHVRVALVEDRVLDTSVQRRLAVDPDLVVRCYLAENTSLVEELQRVLAADDPDVRANLAENPSLVLGPALPVPFLRETKEGPALLEDHLNALDPAARAVLERGWEGTLEDLVTACASFSPELV